MKLSLRLLTLATAFLLSVPAFAAKFSYPDEDKEWFTVDIPASWKPEVADDGTLEATSPDEDAYLAFWTLENEKEIESLGDDLEEWLKESVKKLKVNEKPLEKTINGIDFTIFNGTGIDTEDDSKIGLEIFLFSPKKGKLGIFYCQYAQKAPAAVKGLIKVVESIQLTKKK